MVDTARYGEWGVGAGERGGGGGGGNAFSFSVNFFRLDIAESNTIICPYGYCHSY